MGHFLVWLGQNFDSVWKPTAIVMTGAFGILGLLTDFRDKHTHRIKKWGWVSLIGIVLSTVGGVAAQLKETYKNRLSADESKKQQERLRRPIAEPKLEATFRVDCAALHSRFCYDIEHDKPSDEEYPNYWSRNGISFDVCYFMDQKDVDRFLENQASIHLGKNATHGILQMSVLFAPAGSYRDGGFQSFRIDQQGNHFLVRMEQYNADVWADGNLTSTLDFSGATLIVHGYGDDFEGLIPEYICIDNKDGQKVCTDGPFGRVQLTLHNGEIMPTTAFRYDFPKS